MTLHMLFCRCHCHWYVPRRPSIMVYTGTAGNGNTETARPLEEMRDAAIKLPVLWGVCQHGVWVLRKNIKKNATAALV